MLVFPTGRLGVGQRRALQWALACVFACLLWQATLVQFKFDGNWSGLYLTGAMHTPPSALNGEDIYRFSDGSGYDGQFYHYIAHDPLLTRGFASSVDAPRLRWRRILVPGIAAVAAFGNDRWTDVTYRATILLFAFLGCYCLGRISVVLGHSAAWAVCFMFIPAATFALDRMTVDISLVALCAAYALYSLEDREVAVWSVLMLAPLARETGLALIAVEVARQLVRRRWLGALKGALCAVPFVLWALYVAAKTESSSFAGNWLALPLDGLVTRSMRLVDWRPATSPEAVAEVLAAFCLIGIWLALAAAAVWGWHRYKDGGVLGLGSLELGVAAFAAACIFLGSPRVWVDPHAFVRVLSPLFLFLIVAALRDRKYWLLAPACLMLPWLAVESAAQLAVVLRALVAT